MPRWRGPPLCEAASAAERARHRSLGRPPSPAPGLGGKLPGELREPRRAGWRGDRPLGWDAISTPSTSTNRPSAQPAPTALFTMRRSPTSSPRASTRRVASRPMPRPICETPGDCYLSWGADGKVRQLDELLSAPQGARTARRSDGHDRSARRTPRSRDRDQGVASRLGRDRPGKTDRHAACAPRSSRRAPSEVC